MRVTPFLCLLLICCQGKGESKPKEDVNIGEKKVVMVIAPDKFRDEELFETRKELESNGVKVSVASSTTQEVTGMLGGKAKPDIKLTDVNVSQYDGVVFVGGVGAAVYFDDQIALKIAKDAFASGKVIGAICIAPSILANAGILKGKKVTAFESEKDNLISKGAIWDDGPVTVDGKIITGNGPKSASQFGKAIYNAL